MLPEETSRYLESKGAARRGILKEGYLRHIPEGSSRDRMGYHLERLVEFTRRLNVLESRTSASPQVTPSTLLKTDLYTTVEVCVECIDETGAFKSVEHLLGCWKALLEVVSRLRLASLSDGEVEKAFFLLHLASLILYRQFVANVAETEPKLIELHGRYRELLDQLPHALFTHGLSPVDQVAALTANLISVDHFS